jgi:hypothetical protein
MCRLGLTLRCVFVFCSCLQVDFVKLLMDKLDRLHRKYVDTPLAAQFPRPAFKVSSLHTA